MGRGWGAGERGGGWWGRARGAVVLVVAAVVVLVVAAVVVLVVAAVVVPVVVAVVVPVVEAVVGVRSVVRNEDRVMTLGEDAELRADSAADSAEDSAEDTAPRRDATAELRAAETAAAAALLMLSMLMINDEGVLRTKRVNARVELPDGEPRPSGWTRRTTVWMPGEENVCWYRTPCVEGQQTELWAAGETRTGGVGPTPGAAMPSTRESYGAPGAQSMQML